MKRLFSKLATPMKKSSLPILPVICAVGFMIVPVAENSWAQGRTDKPVNLLQFGQSAPASDNLTRANNLADNGYEEADDTQRPAVASDEQERLSSAIPDNISTEEPPVQAAVSNNLATDTGKASEELKQKH